MWCAVVVRCGGVGCLLVPIGAVLGGVVLSGAVLGVLLSGVVLSDVLWRSAW